VWPDIHGTDDRRIGPEVLLDRTSESVLDRCAAQDDAIV
jgi:hypothetical protein